MRRAALSGILCGACLACAPATHPSLVRYARGTYLQPNYEDFDGTRAYVHFERADLPIRIFVARPLSRARDGTPAQARAGVLDAIRLWEEALREEIPWFDVQISGEPAQADIRVTWLERASGHGASRCVLSDPPTPRLSCAVELSAAPSGVPGTNARFGATGLPQLTADRPESYSVEEIRRLAVHQFGHALGLGHCSCDSVMNESWSPRQDAEITRIDVETVKRLWLLENGTRVDGTRMAIFGE